MEYPHFFIAGTVKGGTTSLFNYLSEHPQIYMSPIKEPHYFSTDIDSSRFRPQYRKMVDFNIEELLKDANRMKSINAVFIRRQEHYMKLFENALPYQILGEASTSYMISDTAAYNIYKVQPSAKIIMMLRNPVMRAYSHYLMNYRSGTVKGTFSEELKKDIDALPKGWGISRQYLEHGLYYSQVKRYFDLFPRENIHIIINEEMSGNTGKAVQDTFHFLGVDINFKPDISIRYNSAHASTSLISSIIFGRKPVRAFLNTIIPSALKEKLYNKLTTNRKFPQLDGETYEYLQKFYSEDIKKLSQLTGIDFSIWNKKRQEDNCPPA
jgi:hypothetical protein